MKCVVAAVACRWARVVILVAAGTFALGMADAALAAPSLNVAEATADTKAIVAAGGQADVVLLGDSLSYDHTFSFRPYFTERVQSVFGTAGYGFISLAGEHVRFDGGWTAGVIGPDDPAPHHGLDGQWLKAMPAMTPPSGGTINPLWGHAQLHYVAEPGGGRITLTRPDDGVRVARLDTNAETRQIRTFEYRAPATTSTALRYQPDGSGPVTLLGLNLVTDNPGIRVHRASNGGWGVNHFHRRDWTFDHELRALGTDLVMVAIGANDTAIPRDEYVAKLNQLVDRVEAAVPEAEVLLIAPYDFGRAELPQTVGAIEQVAAERGAGFINLYETAGSYSFFLQNGYLSDGLHFTKSGGRYVGDLLADAFISNGATLPLGTVPEPSAGALAIAAGAVTLRRRRHK